MTQDFFVTLQGIPLSFKLQFPFHRSAGGSDYYVLHGNVALEDGSGLHAEVSVHMSQVVMQALNGVDESTTRAAAINAIRKTVDSKDIEFIKSTKKQPVHLSSRMYSMVQNRFTFHDATEPQLAEFLKQKAYWTHKLFGRSAKIAGPVEELYLGTGAEPLMRAARSLAASGIIRIEGEDLSPENLNGAEVEGKTRAALAELRAKHEFERTVAHQ